MLETNPGDNMITDASWRISKTIPIWGIVIAVANGLFWGIIIYFTLYTSQMNLEKRVSLLESSSVKEATFVRLDEKMTTVKEDIGEMKAGLGEVRDEIRKGIFKSR